MATTASSRETNIVEHAIDTRNPKDKQQQLAFERAFNERAVQSKPQQLGMMHFFKKGTPLLGTASGGGPVLGWEDTNVICAAGCVAYRYFTKEKAAEEMDITWFTPQIMADLREKGRQLQAAREAGDTAYQMVGIECAHPRFEYRNRARHSPLDSAYLAEVETFDSNYGGFIEEVNRAGFLHRTAAMGNLCKLALAVIQEVRDDCALNKTRSDLGRLQCLEETIERYSISVTGHDYKRRHEQRQQSSEDPSSSAEDDEQETVYRPANRSGDDTDDDDNDTSVDTVVWR